MSLFSSIGKLAKKAVKTVGQGVKVVGKAASVVKSVPGLNVAVMMVPGAAQIDAAVSTASSIVKAANGADPRKKVQALNIVKATAAVAKSPKATPAQRTAAINALTVVKKQAAARKTVLKHRITTQGYTIRVA